MKFEGKTLLILGTNVGSVDMVKYARSEGAYVIVTDYLPKEKSEAKQYANESAMISTTDIEALIEFGRKKHIDGVFCGVSEVNLLSVNAVANALGLPCYFTREQWELTENKAEFKALCRRFGGPVPRDYALSNPPTAEELSAVEYPVIVKPADRSACIGVHICHDENELVAGCKDAYEKSFCGRIVAKEYITGEALTVFYTVINGEYRLSVIADDVFTPCPEIHYFPSKYPEKFLSEYIEKIVKMFKSTGFKDGTFFVQGITDRERTLFFEAGLRMPGLMLARFVRRINHINILQLLVDYSLTGKMKADINLEDPCLKGKKALVFSLINKGGVIKSINGFDEALRVEGVVETEIRYREGDIVADDGTLKQIHMRFYIIRDTVEEVRETVREIKRLVSVRDTEDKNMLVSNVDVDAWLARHEMQERS